jgi:hypothetical protein
MKIKTGPGCRAATRTRRITSTKRRNSRAKPGHDHPKSERQRISEHLSLAKRDIAAGETSFRSAAEHIAAAVAAGAIQAEVAKKIGKSQPWVNRLLKWRSSGYIDDGPFDADNAKRKIISRLINARDHYIVFDDWCRSLCDNAELATWLAELPPDIRRDLASRLPDAAEDQINRSRMLVEVIRSSKLAEAA